MSSASRAAMQVGRTGALAVALGVGAAVLTGTGVAWADRSADQDATSTSSSSSDTPAAPTGKASTRRTARPSPANSAAAANDGPVSARSVAVSLPAAALPAVRNRTPAASVTISAPVTATTPATQRNWRSPAPAAAPVITAPAIASAAETPAPEQPAVIAPTPPAAAAAPVAARAAAASSVDRLLAAVGLTPLDAGSAPGLPTESPALWAVAAWSRRDRSARGVTLAAAALPSAAVVASTPSSLNSTPVGWVTGQRNNAYPGSGWRQTTNPSWANVYGTDVGLMWFNGVNGLTQIAFGDTFSGPNMSGNWRSNVLLLSDDTKLYDGLSLINTGPAYQFIPAARNKVFFIGSETTNIPTSAVYANGENYVSYMSVKSWDTPGRWTTNYSAISMFDPNTNKWVLQNSTVRSAGWFRSSTPYRAGDQNFQQMAYVLEPASQVPEGGTRYVYAFGTPAGRTGSAYLSRVSETSVTDLKQYEYWTGSTWVKNKPAVATAVLGISPRSTGLFGWFKDIANNPKFFGGYFAGLFGARTGGNVSEMSIQYNEYLDKYVVLYGNGANNVILRTADTPEGAWSDPITIATSIQYPGLYAPMIHPLSGTGQLTNANDQPDDSTLYWNMSIWSNYNVVLMKTDLTPLNPVVV